MSEFTNISKWQDLHTTDFAIFNNFVSYWRNGDYDNAFSLLENAQLKDKKFIAGAINIINNALSYLEDNWFDNVPSYLSAQLANFQRAVNELKNRNAYDNTTKYEVGNFVNYNQVWYMCILSAPIGTLPTNTTYWIVLDIIGEQGAYGTGLTLKYSWASSVMYSQYDVVLIGSTLYVAMVGGTGHNPTTSPSYWQVLMTVPQTSIYTGIVAPNSPYIGLIWAKQV